MLAIVQTILHESSVLHIKQQRLRQLSNLPRVTWLVSTLGFEWKQPDSDSYFYLPIQKAEATWLIAGARIWYQISSVSHILLY